MMGRGERVRVSVCTAYLYVLQSFAGKEVSFVAFADFGKIIAGRPSGLALFVADNFNFLDLLVANRAHHLAFIGSFMSQFGGEAFYLSHYFLFTLC